MLADQDIACQRHLEPKQMGQAEILMIRLTMLSALRLEDNGGMI